MTSLVFALHEHHVIMVPSHWHDVGMTSFCSHCICITCVMSSHSHHDVIVFAHESQFQLLCMTDSHLHVMLLSKLLVMVCMWQ